MFVFEGAIRPFTRSYFFGLTQKVTKKVKASSSPFLLVQEFFSFAVLRPVRRSPYLSLRRSFRSFRPASPHPAALQELSRLVGETCGREFALCNFLTFFHLKIPMKHQIHSDNYYQCFLKLVCLTICAMEQKNIDRIIEMAWENRTPFEAIPLQFGLTEAEVILLKRCELKRSSFNLRAQTGQQWRQSETCQNQQSGHCPL